MKRVFLLLATVSMLTLVFSSSVLAASSTPLGEATPQTLPLTRFLAIMLHFLI